MTKADSREKKVLLVEKGKVYVYTMINPDDGYVMDNLVGKTICPRNILNCIPKEILEICSMFPTPQFLYINSNKNWVSESAS